MDLTATKNIILTILAAWFTWLQMWLTNLVKPSTPSLPWANVPDMSKMMWYMNIFMMFMIWSFVYTMQSALWLYIAVTSIFSVVQYAIQYKALLLAKRAEFRWKWVVISK
jgi:membrane protein insertase Oxa1/YidC/SpoIIIJ